MVSQVICVICSVVPEPHTTEITFYKFPKASGRPAAYKAWKNVMVGALLIERPEFANEANFTDTYVCSRHFIASDFSFEHGKLILLNDAVPSRITKDLYDDTVVKEHEKNREYAPPSHGNFASTVTNDFVTTSHHKLRSDLVCTGTSRVSTPSIIEQMSTMKGNCDGIAIDDIGPAGNNIIIAQKRHADLEHKIESYGKIFKRLRSDNVLTESYVDILKVIINHRVLFENYVLIFIFS